MCSETQVEPSPGPTETCLPPLHHPLTKVGGESPSLDTAGATDTSQDIDAQEAESTTNELTDHAQGHELKADPKITIDMEERRENTQIATGGPQTSGNAVGVEKGEEKAESQDQEVKEERRGMLNQHHHHTPLDNQFM